MEIYYEDFASALTLALKLARAQDTDTMTAVLEVTAGKLPDGNTAYRSFYAAARWLKQNPKHIVKASGVVGAQYVDPAEAIADLIDMQAAEDARLELSVPFGYEAVALTLPESNDTPIFPGVVR